MLERLWYFDSRLRPGVERIERGLHKFFPWIIAAAYLLPGMHQSSLGALMLLAGERVHPLWQTPWLPFLYLGAATFMSFGCVAGTTMLCCLVWKRAMDMDVLDEAARITSWLIFGWLAIAHAGHSVPRSAGTAFQADRFAGVFWLETFLIAYGGWMLRRSLRDHEIANDVPGLCPQFAGGHDLSLQPHDIGLYGLAPRRCIFRPPSNSWSRLVSFAMGIAGFLLIVKRFAILPAPIQEWHDMVSYFRFRRPYIRWTGYFKFGFFGENEPTDSD